MNAQAFFEMCRGVTEASTIQPIDSFGGIDEDEFIDFLDEVVPEEPNEPIKSSVAMIANVTVEQMNDESVGSILSEYFKDWLRTNSSVSDDYIEAWNQHADSTCASIEECVREFVLMHFGIKFVGETTIQRLDVSELSCGPLPYAITLEEFLRLKKFECSMYDLQLLSRELDVQTVVTLMSRADYDFQEVMMYVNNPEALQLYVELKIKNIFISEKFEAAICRTTDNSLLRDNYFDKDSILFEIVADEGTGTIELLQQVISSGIQVTPDFLRTFKAAGLLKTVLTAKINGVASGEVEQLLLKCPEAPEWIKDCYCRGELSGGDTSKSLAYCCATAECERRNMNYEELMDSPELTKLLELQHTCRISDIGYLKLLYCLTRRIDVSDMINTTFRSFEHYWVSKVLEDVGIEASIPSFIGDMIVIVNAEGKIRLLDVETIAYNYESFRNTLTSDYQVELLLNNNGVLLVHQTRKSLVPRLVGIHYAAQSSLNRWAHGNVKAFGDPGRCSLYELEDELSEGIPEGLKVWEQHTLSKYKQADRCFGYVLDVVPEARYLFYVKDTQRVIRNILSGVQITDKVTFVWHFLKNFFRDNNNCRVFEKSKKKEYVSDEITLEINGQISRVSIEGLMQGFTGIVESVEMLGAIALDNTQGKIYVKICKKLA